MSFRGSSPSSRCGRTRRSRSRAPALVVASVNRDAVGELDAHLGLLELVLAA